MNTGIRCTCTSDTGVHARASLALRLNGLRDKQGAF